MPDHNLHSFVALAAGQRTLQANICQAETPEAIVALAGALGFTINRNDLRRASRDLSASYWPWSGQGVEQRRKFFAPAREQLSAETHKKPLSCLKSLNWTLRPD